MRATEREWKTKKEIKDNACEKKKQVTRKKENLPVSSNFTSRSKAQQPIVEPVTITEEQIEFEESFDGYFEEYNIALSKLQKLSEEINSDSEDTSSSSDEAKTESD